MIPMTPSTDQMRTIQHFIQEELQKIADLELVEAKKRIESKSRDLVATVAIQLCRNASMERYGPDQISIKIDFDPRRTNENR
jgi:hypothetical protein